MLGARVDDRVHGRRWVPPPLQDTLDGAAQRRRTTRHAARTPAMAETVFTFPCPCCNKLIEVDTRSGRARAVRSEEAKGGRDLNDLLADQRRDAARLGDLFASAKDLEAQKADRLADQLKRAKEEAKKDKNKRPPNIFDLD